METPSRLMTREDHLGKHRITNDAEAIRLCQAGSKQAFGFLVERYMQRAYYTALGLIGSHENALDVSQDAFVRAFKAIKRFDASKKFFTWYYQILRNLCYNFLRDKSRHARSFSEIDENEIRKISDESQEASLLTEKSELKQAVWDGINSLKPNDREIIILKDFQELSYKEIADCLEIPIGTVMSRLYNARKALKAKLERTYL